MSVSRKECFWGKLVEPLVLYHEHQLSIKLCSEAFKHLNFVLSVTHLVSAYPKMGLRC